MMMRRGHAHEAGVERGADRPRIRGTVGVTADRPEDRAMIEAGAAADAAQDVLGLRADEPRAAVVEENDVEVLRPVGLFGPAARSSR